MFDATTARHTAEKARQTYKNNPIYTQKLEEVFERISYMAKNGKNYVSVPFISDDYKHSCLYECVQEALVVLGYNIKANGGIITIYW